MKFCSQCGAFVELRIPEGDNLPRFICSSCETIHYQNPKIVTGCIAEWEDRILLCKRAIEPQHGYWTLPAGFMENYETTANAAERETREEANANVEIIGLYAMFDLPHINQVYLMFRARLLDLHFSPGQESLEVELFQEEDIPWDQLAFPVINETLRHYYQDRPYNRFELRHGKIPPRKDYYSKKS